MYTTTERATTSTVTHGTTVFERHLSGSRRTWLRAIAEANALLGIDFDVRIFNCCVDGCFDYG
jgi:hypothetical protein